MNATPSEITAVADKLERIVDEVNTGTTPAEDTGAGAIANMRVADMLPEPAAPKAFDVPDGLFSETPETKTKTKAPETKAPETEPPKTSVSAPATACDVPPTLSASGKKKKGQLADEIITACNYIGREAQTVDALMKLKAVELREQLDALEKHVTLKRKLVMAMEVSIKRGMPYAGAPPDTLPLETIKKILAGNMTATLGPDGAMAKDPMALLSSDPGEFLFLLNKGVCKASESIGSYLGFPYLSGWSDAVQEMHDPVKEALSQIYAENAEILAPLMSATTRWAILMAMSAGQTAAGNFERTQGKRNGIRIRQEDSRDRAAGQADQRGGPSDPSSRRGTFGEARAGPAPSAAVQL